MEIQRQMVVGGVDANDYQKQRHVVQAVKGALKKVKLHIAGEDVIGKTEPVYYWTREGVPKIGSMRLVGNQVLEVIIKENPQAYPLMIDPALCWGQWQGDPNLDQP